ncbi:MAG: response regulator [Chloroflexota bacterium]|nr:response regulator [Chloroflexota bacterium]
MQTDNHLLLPKTVGLRTATAQITNRRIMVVDNDQPSRGVHPLCHPLTECGYQVTHLVNPCDALVQLKLAANQYQCNEQFTPALVICDLFLRDRDGLDFVQELRGLQQTTREVIPILLVATIESNPTFEQAVLNMGADDFIVKPIRPSDLLLRVRRLIRGLPGIVREQLEFTRLESRRGRELERYRLEESNTPFRALRRDDFDFE